MGYGTGRDHGRAVRRPARLRVRPPVRPADRGDPTPARRVVRRARHRADARHRQWPEAYVGDGAVRELHERGVSLDGDRSIDEAKRCINAWLERNGHGRRHGQLQAPRLAVQPAALLGRAVPDRLRRARPAHRAPRRCCRSRCPTIDDFSPRTFDPDDQISEPESPLDRARVLGGGRTRPRRRAEATTAATPTPCRSGPARAGTSCATSTRPTRTRSSIPRSSATGWARTFDGDSGGVDLYVGGVEHAVLHLLYARFWHKVLFDLGHVSARCEPFHRLFNQGYILAAGVQGRARHLRRRVRGRGARRRVLPRRTSRSRASSARWARA